jgi:hypothetical protein
LELTKMSIGSASTRIFIKSMAYVVVFIDDMIRDTIAGLISDVIATDVFSFEVCDLVIETLSSMRRVCSTMIVSSWRRETSCVPIFDSTKERTQGCMGTWRVASPISLMTANLTTPSREFRARHKSLMIEKLHN